MVVFDWSLILITVIIIEGLTALSRFGFKLSINQIINKIRKTTKRKFLIRIHHLLSGLALAIIAYFFDWNLAFNLGIGIALSDAIHHVLLKIITGDSEFHLGKDEWIVK